MNVPSSAIAAHTAALVAVALAASTTFASGWNEGINGDLSNNQAAPTSVTLAAGANSVIGTVGGTETQDWLTFTVPAGFQLSSLVLASYASNDAQGFMGIQAGASFIGSPFTAGSYLGYTHYGTGATNGALPPTNLIGADLLPLMGNTTLAAGSTGFTPPLGAGTYTLLIQQLGSATEYTFNFNLTQVPTPAGASLLGLGCIGLARRSRRA